MKAVCLLSIFMIPLAPKATGEGDHRSPIREHLMQKLM